MKTRRTRWFDTDEQRELYGFQYKEEVAGPWTDALDDEGERFGAAHEQDRDTYMNFVAGKAAPTAKEAPFWRGFWKGLLDVSFCFFLAAFAAGFIAFAANQFKTFYERLEPVDAAYTIKIGDMRCLVWRGQASCARLPEVAP